MKLKETFDTVSKNYNKDRLTYPTKVYNTILKYQPLTKSDHLLEIGIGTGQGTEFFAKRKNPLIAIDPGKQLVSIAKQNLKKYKNIKYIAKGFEDAKLPKEHFTLAYSPQAFHWVEPKTGLKKLTTILTTDGSLAFFWNVHSIKQLGVGRDTKKLYRKYNMIPKTKAVYPHAKVLSSIRKSSLFRDIKLIEIPWILKYSKEERLKLLLTYSAIIALSPKNKEGFIQDTLKQLEKYPDPLTIQMTTYLVLARKKL